MTKLKDFKDNHKEFEKYWYSKGKIWAQTKSKAKIHIGIFDDISDKLTLRTIQDEDEPDFQSDLDTETDNEEIFEETVT